MRLSSGCFPRQRRRRGAARAEGDSDVPEKAEALQEARPRREGAIERGLDKNRPGKGSRVESVPEGACARLRGWPHVCNGRDKRRYRCSMPFRCEYSAARAQLLADGELSAARRGVDRTEEEFESIAAKIRADLAAACRRRR